MKNQTEKGNVFLGLLLLAGVFLFLLWYLRSDHAFFKDNPEDDPAFEAQMIATGKGWLIEITNKGFVPENVKLKQYDTLTFINKDATSHEIVDIDESCPAANSTRALLPNETFAITFVKDGTCTYQEAEREEWGGVITIEELTKEEIEARKGDLKEE